MSHWQGFASQLLCGTFGELPLVGFAFKDFDGVPTAYGYAPQLEDSLRSSTKAACVHPKAALAEIRPMVLGALQTRPKRRQRSLNSYLKRWSRQQNLQRNLLKMMGIDLTLNKF